MFIYMYVLNCFWKKFDEYVFCKDKFDLKKVLFKINFFVICG